MSDLSFDDPRPASSGLKMADLAGRPLVIVPVEILRDFTTSNGTTTVARCDIWDHTEDDVLHGQLLFGAVVVPTCEASLGRPIVATLGKEGKAAKGKSPAWILTAVTDAKAKTAAIDYAKAHGIAQSVAGAAAASTASKPAAVSDPDSMPF